MKEGVGAGQRPTGHAMAAEDVLLELVLRCARLQLGVGQRGGGGGGGEGGGRGRRGGSGGGFRQWRLLLLSKRKDTGGAGACLGTSLMEREHY